MINDDLLKGLTNTINIKPNNIGWGPLFKQSNGTFIRGPNDLERIMPEDINSIDTDVINEYKNLKKKLTDIKKKQVSINYYV